MSKIHNDRILYEVQCNEKCKKLQYKYNAIDTVDFQKVTIDQLDNYILTASYKFNFGLSKIGLEPFAMYRKSEMLSSIMEVGAMLDYNNIFWVGGSYRKDYGGTGYVGVNIKKNISFAYALHYHKMVIIFCTD